MKTKEQLQAAINEIKGVCERHNIALVGTCDAEGIYGEITIIDASKSGCSWTGIAARIESELWLGAGVEYSISGVGAIPALE